MSESRSSRKVVAIGGGTGLSTLLRGLKEENVDITAIVTVADDGGSSGILRKEMNMPPPGDIRNVLVALAEREPLLQSLFQHRFRNGNGLAGHSIGNLLIAGMQEITGDFVTAIKALSKVLAVRGKVLPAANQSIKLKAIMEDGSIVVGESNIPKANKRISKVWLDPEHIEALPEALEAIEEADIILIGPGSLYTSIIPNLLVKGIKDALQKSKAKKIYISNVMTQPGETDGFTVKDHLSVIRDHIPLHIINTAIVNIGNIPDDILDRYRKEGAIPVSYEEGSLDSFQIEVIKDQLFLMDDYVRHDAQKLSNIIIRLIEGMDKE